MKTFVPKNSITTNWFLIGYIIILFYSLLGKIDGLGEPLKLCTNISLTIFFFIIISKIRYINLKVLLLFIMGIIIAVKSNDYSLFKLVLFCTAGNFVDFRKCVKIEFFFRALLVFLVIFLCSKGIAVDEIIYTDEGIRHSLGFVNPNVMAIAFYILCLDILYLSGMRIRWWNIILCIGLMYYASINSGSRTPVIIFSLLLILLFIYTIKPSFFYNKKIRFIITYSSVFLAILTAIFTFLYIGYGMFGGIGDKYLSVIDRFDRILLFYKEFGFSLFGNDLSVMDMSLDNFYSYVLLGLGIVGMSFYLIYSPKLMKCFYKQNDISMLLIFFCFYIYGLSEKFWMYVDYNIFMLAYSQIIIPRNKQFKI